MNQNQFMYYTQVERGSTVFFKGFYAESIFYFWRSVSCKLFAAQYLTEITPMMVEVKLPGNHGNGKVSENIAFKAHSTLLLT